MHDQGCLHDQDCLHEPHGCLREPHGCLDEARGCLAPGLHCPETAPRCLKPEGLGIEVSGPKPHHVGVSDRGDLTRLPMTGPKPE